MDQQFDVVFAVNSPDTKPPLDIAESIRTALEETLKLKEMEVFRTTTSRSD
jgi:hypothetical protein